MFISVILVNAMCFYRMFTDDVGDGIIIGDIVIVSVFNMSYYIYYSFGYFMIFILNIIHSRNNVLVILRIQMIHKSIDFSQNIKSVIIWNWVSLLCTLAFNIFFSTVYYLSWTYSNCVDFTFDIVSDVMFITFDINLVYAFRVVTLLRKYLEECINIF